jgi:transketolase
MMKNLFLYKRKAFEIRKKLFEKFFLLKEGHPGSVFSILDVLIVLYYGKFIRISNKKPFDDIIMSKGHATVGQYPILEDLGVISRKDWKNWGKNEDTLLKMFGNNFIPGIKTATGSLGHGIGFGTGIVFAANKKKINKKAFVIISEGDLYEGSTWEALLLLASLNLKDVFIILDVNNNIILGNPNDCLKLGNIKKKFESFDIVTEECDGHNFLKIEKTIKKLLKINKPKCLIVNTVKGKGFKIMENKPQWHYWNNISNEQFVKSLDEMESFYAK